MALKRTEIFNYENEEYFTNYNSGNFELKISTPELAVMEMLYLVQQEQSFDETSKIMDGLTTLRPRLVQNLLEKCNSFKVKRLFLFMAEKSQHLWFKELDTHKINIGSGKWVIVKNGVLKKNII